MMKNRNDIPIAPIDSMLIVSVAGIGNTILATPLLRALRQRYPNARLDLLVWNRAAAAPVEADPAIDEVQVTPRGFGAWLRFVYRLRQRRYDAVLTVFPSNQAAYHLFAWLTGARCRIGHAYAGGRKRGEWLLTHRVQADPEIHDVEQNLALLRLFDESAADDMDRRPFFTLTPADRREADEWVRRAGLADKRLIGCHPGAGAAVSLQHWQGYFKRWPQERFAEAIQGLARPDRAFLLFGGPEETELKQAVQSACGDATVHVVDASLSVTAAVLARCELMICNDSGLMHVAAAVGTPVVALFGPTQASRTAPWGDAHTILFKPGAGRPCLRYPFHSSKSKIRCPCAGQCLRDITVDEVIAQAEQQLSREPV